MRIGELCRDRVVTPSSYLLPPATSFLLIPTVRAALALLLKLSERQPTKRVESIVPRDDNHAVPARGLEAHVEFLCYKAKKAAVRSAAARHGTPKRSKAACYEQRGDRYGCCDGRHRADS